MTKLINQLIDDLSHNEIWDNELTLERNEYLNVEGSIDNNMYFIIEGSMRVFVIDEFEEHTIRFGYRNSFLSALDSYITNQPSKFYIQALKKSKVKVLKKKAFHEFMISSEEKKQLWISLLENLVFQQLERELDLLTSSPLDRYKRVKKRSPQLFQEIPNKYIASYLRMTPETLSRLKKY